ncbi:MAG: hypothetical protein KDH90_18760 [Anaerolineae bacterium]|nr:hypothetical protein [Anaerolineae bacterium]
MLVLFEVFQVDEVHGSAVQLNNNSICVTCIKLNAGQRRQQINAVGRITQLNDLVSDQKVIRSKAERSKTELVECCYRLECVSLVQPQPDVEIFGVPWMTMERDRVAAHHEVAHVIIV